MKLGIYGDAEIRGNRRSDSVATAALKIALFLRGKMLVARIKAKPNAGLAARTDDKLALLSHCEAAEGLRKTGTRNNDVGEWG